MNISDNMPDINQWAENRDIAAFIKYINDQVGDENLEWRKLAVSYLAGLEDPESIPILMQTLALTPQLQDEVEFAMMRWDTNAIKRAYSVWGEYLAKPLLEYLLDETQETSIQERTLEMVSRLDRNTAYAIYRELLMRSKMVEQVCACAEKAGVTNDLIRLGFDDDPLCKVASLNVMLHNPITEMTFSDAWDCLEDKDARVRAAAISVMINYVRETNEQRYIGTIKPQIDNYASLVILWCLEDDDPTVRGLTAQLAELLLDSGSSRKIVNLIGDPEPFVRVKALEALRKIPHRDTKQLLLNIYSNKDESPEIRTAALNALEGCRDDGAADLLQNIRGNGKYHAE